MNYFKVNDLALSATLVCLGFPIDHLEPLEEGKVNFVFQDSELLKAAINNYYTDQITVNPKWYFYALRDVKQRLWSDKRQVTGRFTFGKRGDN